MADTDVCGYCNKRITGSAMTLCVVDSTGHGDVPMVHVSGAYIHIHGVRISALDSGTVRFAVRHLVDRNVRRLKWRFRR